VSGVSTGVAWIYADMDGVVDSAYLRVELPDSLLVHERITAGRDHACQLDAFGAASCWGWNGSGQLGEGTTDDSPEPIEVSGSIAFASISAGGEHTCATATDGTGYCWGYNGYYQLGDGSSTNSSTPIEVAGGLAFRQIAAGEYHSCGLTVDGEAYCWGYNGYGQLGTGNFSWYTEPEAVLGGHTFDFIDAGLYFTCGLTTDADLYCWGRGWDGQLGDDNFSSSTSPVLVAGGHSWKQFSTGWYAACGVTTNDAPYCWGSNSWSKGGHTGSGQGSPLLVGGGLTFEWVELGENHTCGLTTNGLNVCWGRNWDGELGTGTTTNQKSSPQLVAYGGTFEEGSFGSYFGCARDDGVGTYCWGVRGETGKLGDGVVSRFLQPAEAAVGVTVDGTNYDISWEGGCAVDVDGNAWCWGDNWNGENGDGSTDFAEYPVQVGADMGLVWAQVSRGDVHSCGVTDAGEGYCWGGNWRGMLGDDTYDGSLDPVLVTGGHTFSKIDAGYEGSCGITTDGALLCWGRYDSGRLGNGAGDFQDREYPDSVLMPVADAVVDLDLGYDYACALTEIGEMYCWGYGGYGSLGLGDWNQQNEPQLVSGGHTWTAVSVGERTTCAIDDADASYCWGRNDYGEIGDGTYNWYNSPQAVESLLSFAGVSVGSYHSCGISTTDVAVCWGANWNGQLGTNSTDDSTVPSLVGGGVSFLDIRVSKGEQSYGVDDAGQLWAWGWGGWDASVMGNGAAWLATRPVAVINP